MSVPSLATDQTTVAPAVVLDTVTKVYGEGAGEIAALREVSFALPRGGFVAVMGPSGSGKSTFLHCAAGLDRPTSGRVWLGGTDLSRLRESALTRVRRQQTGFVFQAYNLLPALTARQNITLPLRLGGGRVDPAWLDRIAATVGIADRLDHRPGQLSGGQQQRVAIARALVTRPAVVFADEPTGALDTRTGRDVLRLLRRIVDDTGQTVLMVTHDPTVATVADRVIFLSDGRLAGHLDAPTADAVAERMTYLGEW